jgi:hypothetical protein
MFRNTGLATVATLLVLSFAAMVGAQSSSSDAAKTKNRITKFGVGADVTVVERGGKTFHGAIGQINNDTFTISEVDLKANVEIRYDQVKRLDKGYSQPSPITGQRMPPKTRKIIGWALAGAAVVLIVVIIKALHDPDF